MGERDTKIVTVLVVVFGVASLLPLNIVYNAAGFYYLRLVGTSFQTSFAYYIQFVGIVSNLLGSFSSVLISKVVNVRVLAVASNLVMGAPIGVMMVLAAVNTGGWQETFFILNLICLFISSFGHGVSSSSVSAIASMIDPELLKPYYTGKGFAGLVAVIITLITLSVPGVGASQAAPYYFLLTTLLVAGLVTFLLYRFINMDYVKECTIKGNHDTIEAAADESEAMPTVELLKFGMLPIIACTLLTLVSLLIFPAMTTTLKSVSADPDGTWATDYFVTVCVYLVFNVGDIVGKVTSTFVLWPGMKLLVILSFGRLALIPLVMMCNIQPRTLPVWFNHDAWPVIFIFLTGFTQGHMLNLGIAAAPRYVEGAVNKGRISLLVFLFIAMGMLVAACGAFGLAAIIDI